MKYKITDFDGEVITGKDGTPVLFDDYDKAKKKAGMGVVVPVDESQLEETVELEEGDLDELTPHQVTYIEVIAKATNHVAKRNKRLGKNKRDGHIFHTALKEIEIRRVSLRGVALQIVQQVAERNLHRSIGYGTMGEFLQAAGWDVSQGHAFQLARLGDTIFPAMTGMGHDTAQYVDAGIGTKLLAAVPALGKAVDGKDPDRVDEILSDVTSMNGRDAVRAKYNRKDPNNIRGHGGGYTVDEDTCVLAVVFNSREDLTWAKQRLGAGVEWDVTGSAGQAKGGLRVFLQP